MDDSTLGTDVAFWQRQITMLEAKVERRFRHERKETRPAPRRIRCDNGSKKHTSRQVPTGGEEATVQETHNLASVNDDIIAPLTTAINAIVNSIEKAEKRDDHQAISSLTQSLIYAIPLLLQARRASHRLPSLGGDECDQKKR